MNWLKKYCKLFLLIFPLYLFSQTPDMKIAPSFEDPKFILPLKIKEEPISKVPYFAEKFYKDKKYQIKVGGRVFPADCSNFARAVFFAAFQIDFFELAETEGVIAHAWDSGVKTIYQLFEKKFRIKKTPEVGDLIFFDNTYDKNRNRKWDSTFTHVAVVIEVKNDGTVVFIHGGTRRGIAKAYMNLNYPHEHKKDGQIINSYLQREYSWYKGKSKLTGELFRAFGGYVTDQR